ncbi:LOW QUALITY PROTEIN: 11-beta-hydroxysteroid dehydrogenase 1 [Macrotis lagotis]|uniref:LOW QUALITY PROTEIN: 11-beta-hydroxysteroid dehydrogenase 1 n=1 Tax=Macrotis lagotis TaxID=92651 RepID=UPI003D6935F7
MASDVPSISEILELSFPKMTQLVEKIEEINFLSAKSVIPQSSTSACCLGRISVPLFAGYLATKFALDGFYFSLLPELQMINVNISITLCILGLVNTITALKALSGHMKYEFSLKGECTLKIIKG